MIQRTIKFLGDLDHPLTLQIGNLGNSRVLSCLGQEGLRSLSALVLTALLPPKNIQKVLRGRYMTHIHMMQELIL